MATWKIEDSDFDDEILTEAIFYNLFYNYGWSKFKDDNWNEGYITEIDIVERYGKMETERLILEKAKEICEKLKEKISKDIEQKNV